MNKEWIVFSNKLNGKELLSLSIEGTFQGEIEATKDLLAYENKINKTDIEIKLK